MRILPSCSVLVLTLALSACNKCDRFIVGTHCPGPEPLTLTMLREEATTPNRLSFTVKVTDHEGVGVVGLKKADFRAFEDGEPVSLFEATTSVAGLPGTFDFHTGLVLDMSGSVSGAALDTLLNAARAFAQTVLLANAGGVSPDLAVWWFDGTATLHPLIGFTRSYADVHLAISSLASVTSVDNSTDLNGTVMRATALMSQRVGLDLNVGKSSASALVIFTDGKDRAHRTADIAAIESVEMVASTVSTFTIGLGREIDRTTLTAIGKAGHVFVEDRKELEEAFATVASHVKADANSVYYVSYCTPSRSLSHTLRVEVTHEGHTGSFVRSFNATDVNTICR
jgi:uncharacterized protein YegL